MRIRKQIYELTVEDFKSFPIWEACLDEEGEDDQDEETFRPRESSGPVDPLEAIYLVHASFLLADGATLDGYLTPPNPGQSRLGVEHPVILTPFGGVMFYSGAIQPSKEKISENYKMLGREAKRVFPIRFQSKVELLGGKVTGTIPGFLFLEDFGSEKVNVVL